MKADASSADPGYEFLDAVTSDLAFVARGATLGAVFAAAGRALLSATLDNPQDVGGGVERRIALEEPDLELLLLRFLNELVYLRDAEELLLVPQHVVVSRDAVARLEADLRGERIQPGRHSLASEVKAATARDLTVTHTPDGWEATVTLDV